MQPMKASSPIVQRNLFEAVIVRRHRAAAEIHALTAIAVADVGEVRDLRAVTDDGVLDLDKVADFDMIADLRVRADIGKGADGRVRADGALIELRGVHLGLVADRAVADHGVRADGAVLLR